MLAEIQVTPSRVPPLFGCAHPADEQARSADADHDAWHGDDFPSNRLLELSPTPESKADAKGALPQPIFASPSRALGKSRKLDDG